MTQNKKTIEGIVPLIPTVYNNKYDLDLEGMRENIEYVVEAGVHGFITNGSVGEFYQTTFEEFKQIVDMAVESAGKLLYMAGTNWQGTRECIQRTKYAEDAGADAAMIVPPYYMGSPACPEEDIIRHYKAVVEATKEIQILIYNNPTLSKANVFPIMDELVSLPRIKAIKESVTATEQMTEVCRKYGNKISVLAGYEADLLQTMLMGGKGTVSIWGSSRPKECLDYYEACKKRDLDKMLKYHFLFNEEAARVNEGSARGDISWIGYFKGLNEVAGRRAGPPRLPYRPLPDTFRAKTKKWLEKLEKVI